MKVNKDQFDALLHKMMQAPPALCFALGAGGSGETVGCSELLRSAIFQD